MTSLLALADANNFVRLLKCIGKLPAIEQWRGRIGPERAAVYNHPQSVWRHFAPLRPVQVAEREDRSTSARQKNQATAEQFYMRYDEAVSLFFAYALLEVVDAIPAPVDEVELSLAAAQG